MTLRDIGIYKGRVCSELIQSDEICNLLTGQEYSEDIETSVSYKQIFPYLFVDETQTEELSYICVEVDVPRTMDFTYKDMKVVVWCYCHKGIMQYDKNGYSGTRVDILADMVDRLLNSSNDFGLGRLRLQSATYFVPHSKFYGRQLVYSCPEFNIDRKL